MSPRNSYLLFLVFTLLLSGCTLEQKIAREYVKSKAPLQFYLLKPDYVFKANLKDYEIPGVDTMSEAMKDSVLLANSLFLKDVKDSVLISDFATSLTTGLEKFGAKVMQESNVDSLMQNGGSPYILNIAQFSLEEYVHPFKHETDVYDEVLTIEGFDVNAINYNVWFELGKMNSEKKNQVLFASEYLTDKVDGTIKQNLLSGKYSFDYTIDTITTVDIYQFALDFGKRSAGYIYDYLMNKYIEANLPESYPFEKYYYHYDPYRKILYPTDESDRLIELKDN